MPVLGAVIQLGNGAKLTFVAVNGSTIGGASVLESWSVPSPPLLNTAQIYSLSSVNQPMLIPGEVYWVMLRAGASETA